MQSVLPISTVDSPGIPLQGLTEKSGRLQLLLDIREVAMSSLTCLCSALYPKPSLAVEASLVRSKAEMRLRKSLQQKELEKYSR